jgi:hypothetical protein
LKEQRRKNFQTSLSDHQDDKCKIKRVEAKSLKRNNATSRENYENSLL